MRRRGVAAAVAVTGLLLSGCGSESKDAVASPGSESTPATTAEPSATPTPTAATAAAADPASVEANELGRVPIFMYHQIKAEPNQEYDQTPEEFKAELQRLYDGGFRPITLRNFLDGKIDIPAGKHPFLMTFDDSSPTQIKIGPDGNPTPETAVGILEQFEKDHPDWTSTGVFYVNTVPTPFNDEKGLPWLAANGYEIGAHTAEHVNLKKLSDANVQKQLAKNVADIQKLVPGYDVFSLSRPFGIASVNEELMYSGSYEGTSYEFDGVMLVGSDPNKSPFHEEFDGRYIHRIRSGPKARPVDTDSKYWLDLLDKDKWTVYTSDGNPDVISYPDDSTIKVASKWADKAKAYSKSSTGSTGSSSTGSSGTGSSGTGSSSTAAPSSASEETPAPSSSPAVMPAN